MRFEWPWIFGLLALLPGLAIVYLRALRRPAPVSVAVSTVSLVARIPQSRWPRHRGALLVLGALITVIGGMARPMLPLPVRRPAAVLVLAIDTSGSMMQTDVAPSRLNAVQVAAGSLISAAPHHVQVGLVRFSNRADLVASPTTERARLRELLGRLTAEGLTAIGEGLDTAVQAIEALRRASGTAVPARIVLLSDGENTAGPDPLGVAARAVDARVPIDAVGLKRDDDPVLRQLARMTGGIYVEAASGEELSAVLARLGAVHVWRWQEQEVSALLAGVAALLTLAVVARVATQII
ncbi:MAG: VWA domain-containing protein [Armatimonadetes bacterium]|nr:VWA domain-containing protein [Armatimonadota bacterium]